MIKRIVKMSFQPERVSEFLSLYEENWQFIRSFPGCDHVELLRAGDSTVFFTYSRWKGEKELDDYKKSELFGRIWPATKALFNEKPQAWTVQDVQF